MFSWGSLFTIISLVGSAISIFEFIRLRQRPGSRPQQLALICGGVFIVLFIGSIIFAPILSPLQVNEHTVNPSPTTNPPTQETGVTPASTQAQPTQVPTPTPPPVGTVLYQADQSWSGWNGSGGWKVNGGLLLNDGTYADYNTMPTITAPYQPGADYAVEIQMQVVSAMTTGTIYPCLYITARGTSVSNGWHGYAAAICANSANGQAAQINAIDTTNNEYDRLSSIPFNPQNTWHTYRLEVKGTTIKFLVDGGSLLTADDSRFLDGSQIGLRSDFMEVKVSSFKIIQL